MFTVTESINSSVHGNTCEAIISATASAAARTSANAAVIAFDALGGGTSFKIAFDIIPNAPSEPVISPARLKPVAHLTVREPVLTREPAESKNSSPMT